MKSVFHIIFSFFYLSAGARESRCTPVTNACIVHFTNHNVQQWQSFGAAAPQLIEQTGINAGWADSLTPSSPPVQFAFFQAQRRSAAQVEIRWATVQEQNSRGFYIQRKQGASWKNIAFVFSASVSGNSGTALEYAYRDNNSNKKAESQYRIQQVALDGEVFYSAVYILPAEARPVQFQVYPNPSATGSASIIFTVAAERDIVLIDASGRMLWQQRTAALAVTLDSLSDGFYSIKITNRSTGEVNVEKLMVHKK